MILKGHLAAWWRLVGAQENQAVQFEGNQAHPERDGGGLVQSGSRGGRGKQKEPGNALKVESMRLADRIDWGCGRWTEVKDDAKVCGLSYSKDGVALN